MLPVTPALDLIFEPRKFRRTEYSHECFTNFFPFFHRNEAAVRLVGSAPITPTGEKTFRGADSLLTMTVPRAVPWAVVVPTLRA